MKRRDLLKSGAAVAILAGLGLPRVALAQGKTTLTFVPQADLTLLDPIQTTGLVTRNHGMVVFDQLFALDDDFNVLPQMVGEFGVSDDRLTWTMSLREGLLFHDNTPVTAEDVVASIKRWWDSGDAYAHDLKNATATLEATSGDTFVFTLSKPFPLITEALGKPAGICAIMPARLAANTPPSTAVAELIGSGPYRYVAAERITGSQTVYEKFEGYKPREDGVSSFTAGPKVAMFDRVVWRAMPDAATASAALQVGEVDWWEQPTPDLLPLLEMSPDITIDVKDTSGFLPMLRLNHLTAPFDNPGVRRAVLPAVDQRAYMTAVMGRDERFWSAGVGFFHPGSRLHSTEGLDLLTGPPDYDLAKRMLDEAGYNNEPVILLVATDLHALNSQGLVAADMFQKMGMNVDFQATDWGTVLQRLASKRSIAEGGWSCFPNYIPGLYGHLPTLHTYIRGIGEAGTFGWPTSEGLEALRAEYMAAETPEQQVDIARRIQLQAIEDVAYVPTGHYVQPTAYRGLKNIRNGFAMFYNAERA